MKRLAVIILMIILMLSGCQQEVPMQPSRDSRAEMPSQSASETVEASSSASVPPETAEIVLESDIYHIGAEDSEQPELMNPPLKALIDLNVVGAMMQVQKLFDGDLLALDKHYCNVLFEYCLRALRQANETLDYPVVTDDTGRKMYEITAAQMQELSDRFFADSRIAALMRGSEHYDSESGCFRVTTGWFSHNYGYTGSCFQVTEERLGDKLTATIRWSEKDGEAIATDTVLFRGKPGAYRLESAICKTAMPGYIKINGDCRPLSDNYLIRGIVGSVGDTVFSRTYADGKMHIYALDAEDFSISKEIVLECDSDVESAVRGTYIQNGMLFLPLYERVIVVDEQLSVKLDTALPEPILQAVNIGTTFAEDKLMEFVTFYGGYAISPDLSYFVYSTMDGVFRCDLQGVQEELLPFTLANGITGLRDFRFAGDGAALYACESTYEGPGTYLRYDFLSGESIFFRYDNLQSMPLISSEHGGFRGYFPMSYGKDIVYLGTGHALAFDVEYTDEGYHARMCVWPFGGIIPQEPMLTADGVNEFEIIAVLDDGRVVFEASRRFVEDIGVYITTA